MMSLKLCTVSTGALIHRVLGSLSQTSTRLCSSKFTSEFFSTSVRLSKPKRTSMQAVHPHLRRPARQVATKSRHFCTTAEDGEATDYEEVDKKALIELETELLRQEGFEVPKVLRPIDWEELLEKSSRRKRKKYLRFLFIKEKRKENDKLNKELKRQEREAKGWTPITVETNIMTEDGRWNYGLWGNTMFLRIREATMNHFYNGRVMSALMHSNPIVFDLGFDEHMDHREASSCANQIVDGLTHNRRHPDPFYVYFCNANKRDSTMKKFVDSVPIAYDPTYPLNICEESYLSMFPKDKLVYLTPHCKEEMTHFDHDAIYIIGGLVDLGDEVPLSLSKAKREGIRMQRLPLDKYLHWGMGGKSLTLDCMMAVMLDIKRTGDWNYALRHIPSRKLKKSLDWALETQKVKRSLKIREKRDRLVQRRIQWYKDD